jgi:hypothetical protein
VPSSVGSMRKSNTKPEDEANTFLQSTSNLLPDYMGHIPDTVLFMNMRSDKN